MTDAQWIVYFSAELAAVSPHLSEHRAFRWAMELIALARHIPPEQAAVTWLAARSPTFLQ